MKKRLIILTTSIILILTSLVVVVFAWFNLSGKTPPIIIVLGKIEVEGNLYDSEDVEIVNPIVIYNVVPGDVFEYELRVRNVGTIYGDLSVTFHFESENEDLLDYVLFIDEDENEIPFSELSYKITGGLVPYKDIPANEGIISFKIKISPDLEFDILNEDDYVLLSKIVIILQQPEL